MRNFLSLSVPDAPESEVVFQIQNYRSLWGFSPDSYQLHMRYLLLDTVTGYRSQYQSLATLVTVR